MTQTHKDLQNAQTQLLYELVTHTHTYNNDITNLQTELNNRSLTTHTHTFVMKDKLLRKR